MLTASFGLHAFAVAGALALLLVETPAPTALPARFVLETAFPVDTVAMQGETLPEIPPAAPHRPALHDHAWAPAGGDARQLLIARSGGAASLVKPGVELTAPRYVANLPIRNGSTSGNGPVDAAPVPAAAAEVPSEATPTPVTAVTAVPTPPRPWPTNEPPAYPPQSVRLGEQGVVLLALCIDAGGHVTAVQVVRTSGFRRLDDAAARAAKMWRYDPAMLAGKAVAIEVNLPVPFALSQ